MASEAKVVMNYFCFFSYVCLYLYISLSLFLSLSLLLCLSVSLSLFLCLLDSLFSFPLTANVETPIRNLFVRRGHELIATAWDFKNAIENVKINLVWVKEQGVIASE